MDRDTKGKFIKGHTHTTESIEKNRLAHLGKEPANKGKTKEDFPKLSNTGAKKGNIPWNKGKLKPDAGYSALHKWIARERGKASKCEHCHIISPKRYEWANISREYKRELDDWMELCSKCHKAYDK